MEKKTYDAAFMKEAIRLLEEQGEKHTIYLLPLFCV